MSVMQERTESKLLLQPEDGVHHAGRIPFVDDSNVTIAQLFRSKVREALIIVVEVNVELGIEAAKIINRANSSIAFIAHEIAERPRSQLLVAANAVAHAHQRACQATKEMRIAVVPVRDPGVGEKTDFQALLHAAPTSPTFSAIKARY